MKNILLVLMWMTISASGAFCQTIQTEYQRLTAELKRAQQSQDSIQNVLNVSRANFDADPTKRDMLGKTIISLEDELYTLNSQVSRLSNSLASMESQPVVPSGGSQIVINQSANRNLASSQFFVDNLTPQAIAVINSTTAVEARVAVLSREIATHYQELEQCHKSYVEAQTPQDVEALFAKAGEIKAKITSLDSEITTLWVPVFDTKMDSYLLIVDRMNSANGISRLDLERIDTESRTMRRNEALVSSYIAPAVATYPLQKMLLAKYELLMASYLELEAAKESIQKAISSIPTQGVSYPDITFPARSFILYSKATTGAKYGTMTVDSIPDLVVPDKGVYYALQIAVTTNPATSMSAFKGVQPLRVTRTASKMYQYTAGGFKDYKSALASIVALQKAGYRSTLSTAAWVDGVVTPLAKARALEETLSKSNAGKFSVEVKTRNQTIISTLRSIVDEYSIGKQITRSVQGDETQFSIFQFTNRAEAEALADIIAAKQNTQAEVIEI